MTVSNLKPAVNDAAFQERFDRLRATYANHDNMVRDLERFVRTAPDDQIVRVNPIQYAADHGRDEPEIIDLFLHARKAGCLPWSGTMRAAGAGES
jgi:uncharacterized protein DUF5939